MEITLKDKAVKLIAENLGDITAKSYANFYMDKNDEVVKSSVVELLTEVIGEKKAKEKTEFL